MIRNPDPKSNIKSPIVPFTDEVKRVLEICEAAFGKQILSAKNITSLPSRSKTVLLIQFADGFKIKLCVTAPDKQSFNWSIRLMEAVGSGNFPRVLLRGAGWAALEWIEGKTIPQQGFSQDIVYKSARLLAAIHDAKIEPPSGTPETILNEVRHKLKANLTVLVSNEIISADQSQSISDLCSFISPHELNISLVHGDFSPANLVISGEDLYSVDNERIGFHVTDYDVCRATTFWDEWNLSGGNLLDTYSNETGRSVACESLFFWGIFDLVYRIGYRISTFGEHSEFCVERLRNTLTTGIFR